MGGFAEASKGMSSPPVSQGPVSNRWSCTTLGEGIHHVEADIMTASDVETEEALLARLKEYWGHWASFECEIVRSRNQGTYRYFECSFIILAAIPKKHPNPLSLIVDICCVSGVFRYAISSGDRREDGNKADRMLGHSPSIPRLKLKLQSYVSYSIAHSNHSRLLCWPAAEAKAPEEAPEEAQDTVPVRPFGLSYFTLHGLNFSTCWYLFKSKMKWVAFRPLMKNFEQPEIHTKMVGNRPLDGIFGYKIISFATVVE